MFCKLYYLLFILYCIIHYFCKFFVNFVNISYINTYLKLLFERTTLFSGTYCIFRFVLNKFTDIIILYLYLYYIIILYLYLHYIIILCLYLYYIIILFILYYIIYIHYYIICELRRNFYQGAIFFAHTIATFQICFL